MNTCECGCGETPLPGKKFMHGHWSRTPEAKALFASRRRIPAGGNPSGLCLCGCGAVTAISERDEAARGYRKGEHQLYIKGHQLRDKRGANANAWRGGRSKIKQGYIYIFAPDHPAATQDGYVFEHRLVAEETIGRLIEPGEHVHHINGVKDDNRPENLVVMKHADHTRMHSAQALDRHYETHDRSEQGRSAGLKGAAARWGNQPTTTG